MTCQKVCMLQIIIVCQFHASHTKCCFLHCRNFLCQESQEAASMALEHNLLHLGSTANKDQFIFIRQLCWRDRSFSHIKFRTFYQFAHRSLCHKQQPVWTQLSYRCHIKHAFLGTVIITEIVHRCSLVAKTAKRYINGFDRMHLACICKYTDLVCIHTVEYIFIFIMNSFFVSLISIFIYKLHITKAIHQEADFHLFHLLLFIDSFFCIFNRCTAFSSVFFLDGVHVFDDHGRHGIIIVQDIFIKSNVFHRLFMLSLQCFNFQTDQFIQTHIQNGICLTFCKKKFCSSLLTGFWLEFNSLCNSFYQTFLDLFTILTATEDLNDQVDHITRFDQTFLNFLFFQFFVQQCVIFTCCDLKHKINVIFNNLLQA